MFCYVYFHPLLYDHCFCFTVPVYVMAGYGGLIVLIYTIFFRTEYKRLLADKCKKDSEDSLEKNMDNAAYIQENETDQVEKF